MEAYNCPQFIDFVSSTNPMDVSNKKTADEESVNEIELNPTLHPNSEKVLGIEWNTRTDEFIFDLRYLAEYSQIVPTKRTVLQAVASVYDPLGVLSPVLIQAKLLFQTLCDTCSSWEDKIENRKLLRI